MPGAAAYLPVSRSSLAWIFWTAVFRIITFASRRGGE